MLKTLCKETRSKSADWKEVVVIPSGLGKEKWFKHILSGDTYYCCDYEGSIFVEMFEGSASYNLNKIKKHLQHEII